MGCNCVTGKLEAPEIDDQRIQHISKQHKINHLLKNSENSKQNQK